MYSFKVESNKACLAWLDQKSMVNISEVEKQFSEQTKDWRNSEYAKRVAKPIIELIKQSDFDRNKYQQLIQSIPQTIKKQAKAIVLAHHGAFGQQEEATKLLKENPELVFEKVTITDYSGRTLKKYQPNTTHFMV